MPEQTIPRKILIVAGEESGEMYGADLARELIALAPDTEIFGLGGDRMRAQGVNILHDIRELASMGATELLFKIGSIYGIFSEIKRRIRSHEFDAVVTIDYPDFNLRIGRAAVSAGVPAFYYVCPQIWAWRKYRLSAIKRFTKLMVILPFERKFYGENGIDAEYVGHPLLPRVEHTANLSRESARAAVGIPPEQTGPVICIAPGSRNGEASKNLPLMLGVAEKILWKFPGARFILPLARHVNHELIESLIASAGAGIRDKVILTRDKTLESFRAADLTIIKSGTGSLEAALVSAPMIIVYKTSFLSFWLARLITHVTYAGLPNLLAGDIEAVPEYLQHRATVDAVSGRALELLGDKVKLDELRNTVEKIRRTLIPGEKAPARRAAEIILEHFKR